MKTPKHPSFSKSLLCLIGFFLTLFIFSHPAYSSVKQADSASHSSPKKWSYEDKVNWLALPQSQIDTADESYAITALQSRAHSSKNPSPRIYLIFNENAEPNNGDARFIQGLAESADVWYVDTSESLFIERTRNTLRGLQGDFVKQIVTLASEQYAEIVVVTYDAMSVAVLRGLRQWQENAEKAILQRLKNLVLLYPSLFVNAPVAGETPEFFPIAYNSAIPISILQPAQGAQSITIEMTAKALRMGGSLVNVEQVPIATDGYYKYQDIRQMADDASQRVPSITNQKMALVKQINYQVAKLTPIDYVIPKSKIIAGLVKLEKPVPMQTIQLKALNGSTITVPDDYKGKALLVNFWATWCPHCVEEIPSMNRALEALDAERFAMISISYKDSKAILEEFVKKVEVDFPILMDLDGQVSKDWKVFAYPSSFLIDANGNIQYSINAGAIWDAPEMLEKLQEVMEIPYVKK